VREFIPAALVIAMTMTVMTMELETRATEVGTAEAAIDAALIASTA
jgi:hypothetical protein